MAGLGVNQSRSWFPWSLAATVNPDLEVTDCECIVNTWDLSFLPSWSYNLFEYILSTLSMLSFGVHRLFRRCDDLLAASHEFFTDQVATNADLKSQVQALQTQIEELTASSKARTERLESFVNILWRRNHCTHFDVADLEMFFSSVTLEDNKFSEAKVEYRTRFAPARNSFLATRNLPFPSAPSITPNGM